MKKKLSRREVVQLMAASGMSAAFNPLNILMQGLVTGAGDRAFAAESGFNPRNLFTVYLYGGAARWNYDLFLTPYSNNNFVYNKQVATRYTASGGRYTGVDYQTISMKGIQVPWMWQFDVPRAGGGNRPMGDLLNNILTLQGLDAFSFEHQTAIVNSFVPLQSVQSLAGLAGDYSNLPIKSATIEAREPIYASKFQNSMVNLPWIGDNNQIAALLDPFVRKTSAAYNSNQNKLKSYLASISDSLAKIAATDRPGSGVLENNRKATVQLMEQSLSSLDTFWVNGLNKYKDLIRRATDTSILFPGINDLPIGVTSGRDVMYRNGFTGHGADTEPMADLRGLIRQTQGQHLPVSFTMAEFLFKNQICPSYHGTADCLHNTWDDHDTGAMPALIYGFYEWRMLSSCILEFNDQMKAAGLFNDTVLGVMSEYGRNAMKDGGGSDHGGYGANSTLYSGCIQGPLVLGRCISSNSEDSGGRYIGTWGEGDRTYDYGHMLSSYAKILRVPTPLTAKPSMITESNGVIAAVAEKMNIVPGI